MANYDSDYEVRLATLEALGGDVNKEYDSVYEIDLEILRLIEEGGGKQVITGTADLIYNQDMSLSTIENVEIDSDVDITTLDFADAKFMFTMKVSGMAMGTIEATGTFTRYSLSYQMGTFTNCRFTFPLFNLQSQSQDVLLINYNDDDNWTAKLLLASQNPTIID